MKKVKVILSVLYVVIITASIMFLLRSAFYNYVEGLLIIVIPAIVINGIVCLVHYKTKNVRYSSIPYWLLIAVAVVLAIRFATVHFPLLEAYLLVLIGYVFVVSVPVILSLIYKVRNV